VSGDQGYKYYNSQRRIGRTSQRRIDGFIKTGLERVNPSLRDPDFLTLRARSRLFSGWLNDLPGDRLRVLDVGGRIQPYRSLLGDRIGCYIAVDPILEGLTDIVAVGEHLPFPDDCFDLVICAQALSYVTHPFLVVNEIHRVLKLGAVLLVSVPTMFPKHHDERWRILPDGLRILLSGFSFTEVVPEGYSMAGIFRTINVMLNNFFVNRIARRTLEVTGFPFFNMMGMVLDRLSHGNDQFTANISARAKK
jgi:SAM-dependent methyltransferase